MLLLATMRVDEAYGVRIAREVERIAGRRVLMGAAYNALDRLEKRGLVTSTVGDPTPERGRPLALYVTSSFDIPDIGAVFLLDPAVALEVGSLKRGEPVTLECPVLEQRVNQALCHVVPEWQE